MKKKKKKKNEKKIDNLNVGINNKFDSLIESLKKIRPAIDVEYHEILKNKNKIMEDSKNSN